MNYCDSSKDNIFSDPSTNIVSSCILKHEYKLERNIEKNLPGDTTKNFKKDIRFQNVKVDNYIVPIYIQDFNYENKKYSISAYANKKMELTTNFNDYKPIQKEIFSNSILLFVLNIISLIFLITQLLSPILEVLLIVLNISNPLQTILSINVINIILLVVNVCLYITKKILLKFNLTKIISKNQNKKIQELKKYIISNQLKMISLDAEKQIEIKNYDAIKNDAIIKDIFDSVMHKALFILLQQNIVVITIH